MNGSMQVMYDLNRRSGSPNSDKSKKFTLTKLETRTAPLPIAKAAITSIFHTLRVNFEDHPNVSKQVYDELSLHISTVDQFLHDLMETPPPVEKKRFGYAEPITLEKGFNHETAKETLNCLVNSMNRSFKDMPGVHMDYYLNINKHLATLEQFVTQSCPPPPVVVQTKRTPTVVVIEGNIGAGKSTLVKMISESPKHQAVCDVFPEPLEVWAPVLPLFYNDPEKYGVIIQMMAMTAHFRNLTKAMSSDKEIVVLERDPRSCNLFAQAMNMDAVPRGIVNHLSAQLSDPAKIEIPKVRMRIFVDATPGTCSRRIRLRNRDGERDIPFDYLQKLDSLHHEYSRDCVGLQFTDEVAFIANEVDDPEFMLQQFDRLIEKIKRTC